MYPDDQQARQMLAASMETIDSYYKERGIFQDRFGLKEMHDSEPPRVNPALQQKARRYAEQSVAQVRRHVFPTHGLLGLV